MTHKTSQVAESVERIGFGCRSVGQFNEPTSEPRTKEREEARLVGCWQSGEYQGSEEAVGEG